MGKEGDELTEQETAIYDRQIRVWGVDAQRRLSKSHIFVSGLKGTVIEGLFAKDPGPIKEGDSAQKISSRLNKQIPGETDWTKGTEPSSGQTTNTNSLADPLCFEAQPKIRNDNLSSSAGASKNSSFMTAIGCPLVIEPGLLVMLLVHSLPSGEFCKNIVLAGVGSLTLNDDRVVTEELLSANFLVPSDENVTHGKSLAELCCESLKDFNPMVAVSVEKGDLANFDVEFFQKFDAVVISCCSLQTKKSVNAKCRKLPRRVAFYTVECRDSCGEIFVDLQNYSYSKKKNEETIDCQLQYPSFEEAVAVPWRSLPKRMSKLYFAMRVIERYEELEKQNPQDTSADDLPNVLRLRKELCEAQCINESQIPDRLLQRLLAARVEFPPVCAIIGGVLGQEVIKAISGKGDPLKNFFFFDAMDGKGIIEDISNINS